MRRRLSLTAFVAVLLAAGCSIVNSIDDVKPADDGKYTAVATSTAGASQDGSSPAPTVDTGITPSAHPVMVVGGEVVARDASAASPVLTVLDPTTGEELGTREAMWVAGVAHDAPRDLWYIFEAPSYFIAGPNDVVKLHIRTLDATSGAWTELSVLDVPPLTYYDAIGVTTERLSYVAQTPNDSGSGVTSLVTIDTSNPDQPVQVDEQALPVTPRGIIATPSSIGAGGQLALVHVGTGAAGQCGQEDGGTTTLCEIIVRQYLMPGGTPVFRTTASLTGFNAAPNAAPAYASVICGGHPDDLVVVPGGGLTNGLETVLTYDNAALTATGTAKSFTMSGPPTSSPTNLRRAAVDQVRRTVFVVEATSDTNLWAVQLDGDPSSGVSHIALGHAGQSVYYEPASNTVFAPFNQADGYTFGPFTLTDAGALQARTGTWNPPADLRPVVLGIRDPATLACP